MVLRKLVGIITKTLVSSTITVRKNNTFEINFAEFNGDSTRQSHRAKMFTMKPIILIGTLSSTQLINLNAGKLE